MFLPCDLVVCTQDCSARGTSYTHNGDDIRKGEMFLILRWVENGHSVICSRRGIMRIDMTVIQNKFRKVSV